MNTIKCMPLGICQTNCYILYNENKDALLIDPADSPEAISSFIDKEKIRPLAILLTHGHFDHIHAVEGIKAKYAIPVYAEEHERELLNSPELNMTDRVPPVVRIEADRYLCDGEHLTCNEFSVQCIWTPGHTLGSCSYLVDGVLFSGDTLFEGTRGRTDFPTGSESSIIRSIKDKLLVLDEDMQVYPGHGSNTTIGAEKDEY